MDLAGGYGDVARDGGVAMTVQSFKQQDQRAKNAGHPIMFGLPLAEHFGPFPEGGGYPHGFLRRAYSLLGVDDPSKVLHVCSGSMRIGIRVDIRVSVCPSLVAHALHLPYRDNAFRWVMADPPYSAEYAQNLYGTGQDYPSPHALVEECLRVACVGGRVGVMHHMVPKFHKPARLLGVYGITQGPGYNIRAWTLLEKH